jgi:hypothetical protein
MSRLRRGEVGSGDDAGYRGGHDELDRGATSAWRGGRSLYLNCHYAHICFLLNQVKSIYHDCSSNWKKIQ